MLKQLDEKSSRNKETLKNIIDQKDLTDVCKTFHPTTADYFFFSSSVHETLSKADHILVHKTSHQNLRKSITTDTKRITEYYEKLYIQKFNNSDKIEQFP